MLHTRLCLALLLILCSSPALSQLVEQEARVRTISYDNHSDVVPVPDVRVRVETEERSDGQGFVSLKISEQNDGTYRFRDIKKTGYALISPSEAELSSRRYALNPHAFHDIILVSKIDLQKEKKRIITARNRHVEQLIQSLKEKLSQEQDKAKQLELQEELDQFYTNYDEILKHIEEEADRLARIDCLTLSDIELKNINLKKEGKADELIAFNKSLLPENEEEQARALIAAMQRGEIDMEQKIRLQEHWGEIYKNLALGYQLDSKHEQAEKWLQFRTELNPDSFAYHLDYAQFAEDTLGDYQKSLSAYTRCLHLAQQSNNSQKDIFHLHLCIGANQARLSDYSTAFSHFVKALDIGKGLQEGAHAATAEVYTYIADAEMRRKNTQRAADYLTKAIALFQDNPQHSHKSAMKCYLLYASHLVREDKTNEAAQYLKLARTLIAHSSETEQLSIAQCDEIAAIIALKKNDLPRAKQSLHACIKIREKLLPDSHPDRRRAYQLLDDLRHTSRPPAQN